MTCNAKYVHYALRAAFAACCNAYSNLDEHCHSMQRKKQQIFQSHFATAAHDDKFMEYAADKEYQ